MERFIGVLTSDGQVEMVARPGKACTVSSSDEGLAELVEQLNRLHPTLIILLAGSKEAAQAYHFFRQAKLPVIDITARQANEFAEQLAQSEIDAELLARFGESIRPKSLVKDNRQNEEFNALLTRRLQVIEMLSTEKNRLIASSALFAASIYVKRNLEKQISELSLSLEDLDTHLKPFWLMQTDDETS